MSSNFAERELLKYGWKKGKGLGVNQNGIVEPLTIHRQKDTAGLGSSEGLYHPWWDDAYKNALCGVKIKPNYVEIEENIRDNENNDDVNIKSKSITPLQTQSEKQNGLDNIDDSTSSKNMKQKKTYTFKERKIPKKKPLKGSNSSNVKVKKSKSKHRNATSYDHRELE